MDRRCFFKHSGLGLLLGSSLSAFGETLPSKNAKETVYNPTLSSAIPDRDYLRFRRERPIKPYRAWNSNTRIIWHRDEDIYYENPRNRFCYFRKTFQIKGNVASSKIRINADTKYILYINGRYIGRGPSRFDPHWVYFDIYDITDTLEIGDNVIAVLVLFHGYGTGAQASLMQALFVEADIQQKDGKKLIITSDTSWKAKIADAYDSDAPRLNGRLGPMEVVDLRKIPKNWNQVKFNDSDWAKTAVMRGDLNNVQWINLVPRDIPHLQEKEHSVRWILNQGICDTNPPAVNELGEIRDTIQWESNSGSKRKFPDTGYRVTGRGFQQANVVNLDLGENISGVIEMELSGSDGSIVDVLYAEELWNRIVPHGHNSRVPLDRFILKQGSNTARVYFGFKAFRYLQLWIWSDQNINIKKINAIKIGYPTPNIQTPLTDNQTFNQILECSIRTLRMCMQDGFLDSSSREQQQWIGDGRKQAITAFYMFGTKPLWQRLLRQIGQSQDWMGGLMPRHPGRHENISPIPQFMLDWIFGMWDYYWYTAETQLLNDWWPNMIMVMRWFSAFENQVGLLENVPHWMYIDWGGLPEGRMPDVNRSGIITALNIKYLAAMQIMLKLAHLFKDDQALAYYTPLVERLEQSIHQYTWDRQRGAFVDCVVNGKKSPVLSEVTNSLALQHLTLNKKQMSTIVKIVFKPNTDDIVPVSPAYTMEYGRALTRAGHTELAFQRLVQRFGRMINAGAITLWERWGLFDPGNKPVIASASHGWGSAIFSFYVESVLGVHFSEPGFKNVTVCPRTDLLAKTSGHVCTNNGILRLAWKKTNDKILINIECPEKLNGRLIDRQGKEYPLKTGQIKIG